MPWRSNSGTIIRNLCWHFNKHFLRTLQTSTQFIIKLNHGKSFTEESQCVSQHLISNSMFQQRRERASVLKDKIRHYFQSIFNSNRSHEAWPSGKQQHWVFHAIFISTLHNTEFSLFAWRHHGTWHLLGWKNFLLKRWNKYLYTGNISSSSNPKWFWN